MISEIVGNSLPLRDLTTRAGDASLPPQTEPVALPLCHAKTTLVRFPPASDGGCLSPALLALCLLPAEVILEVRCAGVRRLACFSLFVAGSAVTLVAWMGVGAGPHKRDAVCTTTAGPGS